MTKRTIITIVALALVLGIGAGAVFVGREAQTAFKPSMRPAGTYQYIRIEGPLLFAWDTRTGAHRFCLIRPPADGNGATLDCGQ